jgi:hypothetical protein
MPRLSKIRVTTPYTSEKANVSDLGRSNEFARDRAVGGKPPVSKHEANLMGETIWGEHVPTADDVANMAPIA